MVGSGANVLSSLLSRTDNSAKRDLVIDPSSAEQWPNQESRESFGHYVEVLPDPLPRPYLVASSPPMAKTLGIDPSEVASEALVAFLSGDVSAASTEVRPWATPYAVSVFSQPIPSPDPFGRGNGYGDGRALSLCEVVGEGGDRWELQLKGGGTTPFSRGGDGRAVLRSSIREFLVSEAMHALRVPTTRALSLVASASQRVRRMWYGANDRGRDHPPDTLISEGCAITCRVAPSFLRVGHLELHSRRLMRSPGHGEPSQAEARDQFIALFDHALAREFAGEVDSTAPLPSRIVQALKVFAQRQVALTVHWIRVGYVQGNMNSDNCLLSGRTMDYGPFGFIEQYSPLWSPFTSDAEKKFGFERQPTAAQMNLLTLARALVQLLDEKDESYEGTITQVQELVQTTYPAMAEAALGEMRRSKLGVREWSAEADKQLWKPLQSLMGRSAVDYTILFRQLSYLTTAELGDATAVAPSADAASPLLAKLSPAFYEEPPTEGGLAEEWRAWLLSYAARVTEEGRPEGERHAEMRLASPKYVPREWMLAMAYEAAQKGDHSVTQELFDLFAAPYDEQPQLEPKYYVRTPEHSRGRAGISYFS